MFRIIWATDSNLHHISSDTIFGYCFLQNHNLDAYIIITYSYQLGGIRVIQAPSLLLVFYMYLLQWISMQQFLKLAKWQIMVAHCGVFSSIIIDTCMYLWINLIEVIDTWSISKNLESVHGCLPLDLSCYSYFNKHIATILVTMHAFTTINIVS